MNAIENKRSHIGRANTVLVFDSGPEPAAVIATVVVKVKSTQNSNRIHFSGPATFDEKCAVHIAKVVLPVVDVIVDGLGIARSSFAISMVNLGMAAAHDIGLKVSGFSADVAVIIGILSASLHIPIGHDFAFTGHIASSDGDIRMVKDMPVKLRAAIQSGSIQHFIHPHAESDNSLAILSPSENQTIEDAIIKAKRDIQTIAISDIAELIQVAFSEESVILSGLEMGFFEKNLEMVLKKSALGRAFSFLTKDCHERFWKILEGSMLSGSGKKTSMLLAAFIGFYINQETYPESIGIRLRNLLQSLPPETRRTTIKFPLIPIADCLKLGPFAAGSDQEDMVDLMDAVSGRLPGRLQLPRSQEKSGDLDSLDNKTDRLAKSILSEISNKNLTTQIRHPIDTARSSYSIRSVIVESKDDFYDHITAYYRHLLRHTGRAIEPLNENALASEGLDLLKKAFSKTGGEKAAFAEARDGTRGGLRFVLDAMTKHYIRREQEKYVQYILTTALDPEDPEYNIRLMRALMKQMKHLLPEEVICQPAERYIENFEEIVIAYVNSLNQFQEFIRAR